MLFWRLIFFKINFFKKFFQKHYRNVKQFGSRSGLTLCRSWSGSKLFAKVISWKIFMLFCHLLTFSKSTFSKKYFINTIVMSNSLDLDQDWHCVSPDLDQNCLQRLLDGKCSCFFVICWLFQNQLFQIISGILLGCQMVWIQIRTDIISVLIWVQTVCKGY